MLITHYRLLVDNNSIFPVVIGLAQSIAPSTGGMCTSEMAVCTAIKSTAAIVCGSSGTFYHKMALFLQNL